MMVNLNYRNSHDFGVTVMFVVATIVDVDIVVEMVHSHDFAMIAVDSYMDPLEPYYVVEMIARNRNAAVYCWNS